MQHNNCQWRGGVFQIKHIDGPGTEILHLEKVRAILQKSLLLKANLPNPEVFLRNNFNRRRLESFRGDHKCCNENKSRSSISHTGRWAHPSPLWAFLQVGETPEPGTRRGTVLVEIKGLTEFCSWNGSWLLWMQKPGLLVFTKGPAILHSYDLPRFSFAFPSTPLKSGELAQGIANIGIPASSVKLLQFKNYYCAV